MSPEGDRKAEFLNIAEVLIKLTSVVLGICYVLGLLISNIQLMQVGISDFSSLQVRNIMTGFIFVVYVCAIYGVLAPILIGIWKWGKAGGLAWTDEFEGFPVKDLISMFLLSFLLTFIAGSLLGYLYPWGLTWEEGAASFPRAYWHWSLFWTMTVKTLSQFISSYWYPKSIVALFGAFTLFGFWVLIFALDVSKPRPSGVARLSVAWIESEAAGLLLGLVALMPLPLLLVSFANDVYPNVKYNLGGGQPQVAEFELATESTTKMPDVPLCMEIKCSEQTHRTGPLVIWHQSEKFIYVSRFPTKDHDSFQLIALDMQQIRAIHYRRQYVRIESGGRSRGVGSY